MIIPLWLQALIVTTVVGAIVGGIVKFAGGQIARWLMAALTAVAIGATMDRNKVADDEYRNTISATIEALKERISLLERWRLEAQELEGRVNELEEQIRELRKQGLDKDDEIIEATKELNKTRRALADREASISDLQNDLLNEKNLVSQLQTQLAEAIAVQADNQLKIGALLHQAGGSDGV